ncbi:PREDICTED: cilia- and flagella-associated protein 58-like [Nicrophorus vespilloides]|uniref:Cilia- and flagella-associated protein 58-like n=1 Tax=Nicrophorus vespilloides TaxID=110193 RepID=A0ABM1MZT8_NICVS|nr:PREDICTED: cilia- and flagella-associated protein 58-like [Nicrophorus vespilloides]
MDDAEFAEELEEDMNAEDELDPNNPDDAFAIVERDYTKICAELEEDQEMVRFADEFTKLFDYMYKTREDYVQLQDAHAQLELEALDNSDRLQTSMKVIKNDTATIKTLKEEVDNSHKLIDNAHAREQAAQEIIDNLRKQIANLNAEIDFKNKMAQGEMEENPQLTKHREGLEREKAKLMSEVSKLNEKLNNALAYQDELERRTSQADLTINEINGQLEETSAEVDRYKRHKERLETELEESQMESMNRQEEIDSLNDTIVTNQRLLGKFELHLKEQQAASLKCFKELEGWNAKYSKMQDELDALNYTYESLKKEHANTVHDLKAKDEERNHLSIDLAKLTKSKEQADNRTKHMEKEKYDIIEDRNKLRQVIAEMEMDLQGRKRQADSDKRNIENLSREKEILNKNLMRQQAVGRDHIKLIKVQEQAKRKLESDIDNHVIETRKQNKQISYLEKERDRLLEEELDLTKKIEDTLDEVKLKKNQIYELKKTQAENENKLRMQQNMFDAVRADKNALQKSLQEANAEGHELKSKLKTNMHQTEQLKEDISMKEQLLIKEETILRKITKEKENMKIELNICWDQIRSLREEIVERKDEEKRLHKVIVTSDRMIRDQGKTITQLMNERDVLGSQLVRRNDELSLLYEKIKILQTTLHRGEAQYDQRLQDIKLLKVEIKRLRQEKSLLTKSINNMTDLQQEVFHLERDLTKERLKTKALEDELQNPMNVHRWRKLEGSDPEVFDLLQKITLLQKRLLNQSSQAVEKETQLKEAEQLYMNLRQVVSKQPGPEIKTQLMKTQRSLNSHINKMKCLVSELNMTEAQANSYKLDLDKVSDELVDTRKKLVQERKQHARELEGLRSKIGNPTDAAQQQQQQMKFVGGGFRVSLSSGEY